MKQYKVAILGVGNRGAGYGTIINSMKDKFKIVSLCDLIEEKLIRFQKIFDVNEKDCFLDCEEFFKEKFFRYITI